jgi:hypothetical protein
MAGRTQRPAVIRQISKVAAESHRALPQVRTPDFRLGAKGDIVAVVTNVRFTPKSGHSRATIGCSLSAKSSAAAKTRLLNHLVSAAEAPG